MTPSWFDIVLVLIVVFQSVLGLEQGFALGLFSLIAYAVALLAFAAGAPWAAGWLNGQFHWPLGLVLLVLTVVLLVVFRPISGWVTAQLDKRVSRDSALQQANRRLGVVPGAAWGLVNALLVAWLYQNFSGPLPPHSTVATTLLKGAEQSVGAVTDRLGYTWPHFVLFKR